MSTDHAASGRATSEQAALARAGDSQPPSSRRAQLTEIWRRPWVPPAVAGLVGLLIVAMLGGNEPWQAATALVVVYALATVGLNFAQGASGLFTMATAAFVGVGGYATGYLTTAQHWSALAALLGGIVISLIVGSIFALLTLRVSEIYLAIATLALVEIFGGLVDAYPGITGGVNGIPAIPPLSILGFTGDSPAKIAILNIIIMTILSVIAALILAARPGRSMRAIREDKLAASGAGVSVNGSLNLAFVLSAVYGSVAGSLYATTIQYVDPTAFTLDMSVIVIAMLVIGGSGSVVGALIGAAALQFISQALTSFQYYSQILFGLVIVLAALFFSAGVTGGLDLVTERIPALRKILKPPAPARDPVAIRHPAPAAPDGPAAPRTGASLVATGIAKSFGGVKALQGVDLTIMPGQIHALIGPNGSGKSTFINVLCGLYKPDAGSIMLGDTRIDRLPVASRASTGLARTYQNGRLFAGLTVTENVRIAGDHRNKQPGVIGRQYPGVTGAAWVDLVVDLVGIAHLETSRAGDCGFGNQRRIELARALALDPDFLLLDEPAAGQAQPEKEALGGLLGTFRTLGMGILLVEHSMDVVMSVADTVTVLDFGVPIGQGAPPDIRANQRVIDAYLGVT